MIVFSHSTCDCRGSWDDMWFSIVSWTVWVFWCETVGLSLPMFFLMSIHTIWVYQAGPGGVYVQLSLGLCCHHPSENGEPTPWPCCHWVNASLQLHTRDRRVQCQRAFLHSTFSAMLLPGGNGNSDPSWSQFYFNQCIRYFEFFISKTQLDIL